MFLIDFLQHLKRYGRDRLPELQIKTDDQGSTKGGFVLVYRDRDGADLMLDGRRLGSVVWRDGEVIYEPEINLSEALSFDGHLDRWVGHACAKAGVQHLDATDVADPDDYEDLARRAGGPANDGTVPRQTQREE
jgi:hypothetical protein